ncbi:Heterokaryon incompatibility protein (HET) domain containing protein [Naviculisporaceae sp. PSN 640]
MAWSAGPGPTWTLKLEGGLSSLQKRSQRGDHSCPTIALILHACSSLPRDAQDEKAPKIEIHRAGSNLFLKGHTAPLLSLRRWIRTANPQELSDSDRSSLERNSEIQTGWPDLPPNTEAPAYFALLGYWLRDCDRNHQQCRVGHLPKPLSGPFLPTRLLEVGRSRTRVWLRETKHMTVDEVRGDIRYVALSHPWGDAKLHNHFCTTHANVASRICGGISVEDFPNTLKDAIRVTQALNIRYLWVDTLCIIQGNDGDFDTEAKRMEMVYSMAYLVIAASRATGTSDGFLSPRPSRRYAILPAKPISEDGRHGNRQSGREDKLDNSVTYLCEAIDDFQKDVIDGPLSKRGWVLQERALARRTIYFTHSQTYFECGAGVRCETMAKMTNDQAAFLGDPDFPAVAMKSTKGAKIRFCQSLYETYSALEFSKAQDRSIAIAGLEQRLVRAFNTDGAYGVFDGGPSFFGRTLLWMRDTRVQDAMRLIDFDFFSEGAEEKASNMYYVVPSWSWMAYEGVITFMDLPFSGVEWRYVDEGLVAPWTVLHNEDAPGRSTSNAIPATYTGFPTDGSATWHTGRTEWRRRRRGPALKARARNLTIPSTQLFGLKVYQRAEIIFDDGKRPEETDLKCVIIGRKRVPDDATPTADTINVHDLDHYVLVVARRGDLKPTEYRRVGVGSIPGSWIDLDGSGEKILVL